MEEALWQAVVLIPKGDMKLCGIGLVKVLWKVVTVIINLYFTTSIAFHKILHGFWAGFSTGIASLQAKILHKLTTMKEEVLYTIFLDLKNVYGTLDRDI